MDSNRSCAVGFCSRTEQPADSKVLELYAQNSKQSSAEVPLRGSTLRHRCTWRMTPRRKMIEASNIQAPRRRHRWGSRVCCSLANYKFCPVSASAFLACSHSKEPWIIRTNLRVSISNYPTCTYWLAPTPCIVRIASKLVHSWDNRLFNASDIC